MNDLKNEYLPNGNGHTNGNGNGNGNGKIFDLVKAQDPILAQVVPTARRRICENETLTAGARMFFCYTIDLSLLPGVMSRRGVLKKSDEDLAERLKVSARTIQNWKREIKATGEVWMTEKWMKNTFPQTVYNFACIVGQAMLPLNVDSDDGSLPDDEIFTSNRRRQRRAQRDPNTGRFAGRVTPPGVRSIVPADPEPSKIEQNAPSEKFLPSTTERIFGPPPKESSVHHGKSFPSPTENPFRAARKDVSAVHGKSFPLSTENSFRGAPQNDADKGEAKDVSLRDPETSFKRSTGLNASKKDLDARKREAEKHFLEDVAVVMDRWKFGHGKFELDNSGAFYRQCHRADAQLAARVLADASCAVKEGRIKETPGQYFVDLWKRWSKEKLQDALKQKAAGKAAAART